MKKQVFEVGSRKTMRIANITEIESDNGPIEGKDVLCLPVGPFLVRIVKQKIGWLRSRLVWILETAEHSKYSDVICELVGDVDHSDSLEFTRFILRQPSFQHLVSRKDWISLNAAFTSWLHLKYKRIDNERLSESIQCLGFNQGSVRCGQPTLNATGLCRHHSKPGSSTMWNCDWVSERSQTFERENRLTNLRIERERRWRDIAARIKCEATDKQLYLLLDFGYKPRQLNGISKAKASELIDRELSKRGPL